MSSSTVEHPGYREWLAWREDDVAGPTGHLALTGTYEVWEQTAIPGVPGVWSVSPAGLHVTAPAGSGLRVDGVEVAGISIVEPGVTPVDAPGVAIRTFLRDGRPVVRTYEREAPALARYAGVERFAYQDRWRVPARFEPYEVPEPTPIPYQRDEVVREHVVVGVLSFELDGEVRRVRAFEGHGGLWFVFADATTGVSTYRPGRFVESARDERDGGYVIDFNRAYLPPCAFSHHYNCPLPPRENVLGVAIEAGERSVVLRPDGESHGGAS